MTLHKIDFLMIAVNEEIQFIISNKIANSNKHFHINSRFNNYQTTPIKINIENGKVKTSPKKQNVNVIDDVRSVNKNTNEIFINSRKAKHNYNTRGNYNLLYANHEIYRRFINK